ncbi:MAG TPA: hypothetical protein PKE69_08150 [Pyrinomonadaceae bacterium]|nr:hypothetical protein [Pyrinomonadaceae bacterium]
MNWIKQKTWRILLLTLVFIGVLTLFFKYGLSFSDWKDAIQTATQVVVVFGLVFAWKQIKLASEQVQKAGEQIKATKELHNIQFEDSLAREYRELTQNLPIEALLGKRLSKEEFENARKYLFHYINLTNDQIFLRSKGRISDDTWTDWKDGIKSNMNLPAFEKMWKEIETSENKKDDLQKSFQELRRLKSKDYEPDPKDWNSIKINF